MNKTEIKGIVTKAVPYCDSYGRYGLTVTAKTEDGYLHTHVLEPDTKVIIKGHKVTFKGKIAKITNCGPNKVIIMNYADTKGKKQKFFKGYGYQLKLFEG